MIMADIVAFRDALLLHLELLPAPTTTDTLVAKLVQAGSTLEFLKYSEQLFELLFVGGLLQPGGSYLDEKRSPAYILKDDSLEGGNSVKGMVEVFKRVIQRYKYLQKPLEENFLPDLLGYLGKWDPEAREKLANATALFIIELQLSPKCLSSLSKDHVVKDGVALDFLTAFCKQYFASKQTIDQLGSAIRRSGLKDIASTIPLQTRTRQYLDDHFKQAGLPQVNEWYAKLALGEVKDQTISNLASLINDEEPVATVSRPNIALSAYSCQIVETLKTQQAEKPVPEAELVDWLWQGLMKTIDWTARPDQLDAAVVAHVTAYAPILEAFANGAKAEIALINAVQVYCYADTRIMKSFLSIVKVLYNTDCVSDQAIIYWHQKGAKPQGKQHFIKATEGLVKVSLHIVR